MGNYGETQNEKQKQPGAAARNAHEQASEVTQAANPADAFAGLPMESLICNPVIAAAKGQQELSTVYIDTLMNSDHADGGSETDKKTNTPDSPHGAL